VQIKAIEKHDLLSLDPAEGGDGFTVLVFQVHIVDRLSSCAQSAPPALSAGPNPRKGFDKNNYFAEM